MTTIRWTLLSALLWVLLVWLARGAFCLDCTMPCLSSEDCLGACVCVGHDDLDLQGVCMPPVGE